MLSKDLFQEVLAMFSINFGFEIKGEEGQIYKKIVYDSLKDKISDSAFKNISNSILLKTTLEDWNKAYGFKGKPAIADWVQTFVPKKEFVEKTEIYKCPITSANLSRRVMVEVGSQLTIEG